MNLTREIKSIALKLGFHTVGITSAEPVSEAGAHYLNWLSDGFAGEMQYLHKSPEIRFDPKQRFPEAKSIIVLTLNYYQEQTAQQPQQTSLIRNHDEDPKAISGKISCYAWGEDYHTIIEKKLETLICAITELGGSCWKGYVDHGPLLERAFAERAGLGFIGKNTNLITTDYGSWVFLAEVITDLDLLEDKPSTGQCGTCRRCIDACPTEALREPYRLDARRCISYLTIENKGSIPPTLVPKMEGWLFGCDICQEVCPFNGQATVTNEPGLSMNRGAGPSLPIRAVMDIPDNRTFKQLFPNSPLLRAKRSGLLRNASVLSQSDILEEQEQS